MSSPSSLNPRTQTNTIVIVRNRKVQVVLFFCFYPICFLYNDKYLYLLMRKKSAQIQASQIELLKIRKIQRAWRKHQFRKQINNFLKKKKKKKMTAMELLNSEKKYTENLTKFVSEVMIPAKQAIDDGQLHALMFSQLKGIQQLHESFFMKINSVISNYTHYQTKISQVLIEELFNKPQFKIKYSNYCGNYPKANKISKLLFSNNSGLNEILKKFGIYNENQLDSELISPMQRLCKYEVILSSYHKSMLPDHCDYAGIEKAILIVENLVKQTNQQVQQYLLADKFRIYNQFHSDILKTIPSKNRRLVFIIQDIQIVNLETDVATNYQQLAMFNDSILLLSNSSQNKPIFAKLLYVRDLPNLKYFKNNVQVINSGPYLNIHFKKLKHKEDFLDKVQRTDVNTDKNNFVDVKVLGTETRQAVFKTYTVYIVQIGQEGSDSKKIYPRFKDLLKIQQIIQNKCQKDVKYALPSLTKESLFSTLKSKTIERRKLIIQQFLEKIVNMSDTLNLAQVKKLLKFNPQHHQINKSKQKQIIINLPGGQEVSLLIPIQGSSVFDLKTALSEKLGLTNNDQFQIFQVRTKAKRLMYDDELVSDIYKEQQSYLNSINPFKDTLSYLYTRHHYLQPEQQFQIYKNDFVRTELELSVIKAQIRNYQLEEELMITFMCLFAMYTNLPVHDQKKLSNYLKQIGKKQYKVSIEDFKSYYSEVEKKVEEEDDQAITIPFLIIKIMNNSFLYQCQQFELTVHAKSLKEIKKYVPGLEEKIILGIKRTHILLLTVESKHIVQSFPLESVQIIEMYPTALVLKLPEIESLIRLNTQNGYEISRVFDIYKEKL